MSQPPQFYFTWRGSMALLFLCSSHRFFQFKHLAIGSGVAVKLATRTVRICFPCDPEKSRVEGEMTKQRILDYRLFALSLFAIAAVVWLNGQAAAAGTLATLPAPSQQQPAEILNGANRARAVMAERCFQCHGQNGKANKDIFVLNRERLLAARVVIPGDINSPLLRLVESGAMPMGQTRLTDEEIAVLRVWVLNGAAAWNTPAPPTAAPRSALPESAILGQIREDLERVPERSRQYVRYLSLAHLYNAGASNEDLVTYRVAIAKLINSLSTH